MFKRSLIAALAAASLFAAAPAANATDCHDGAVAAGVGVGIGLDLLGGIGPGLIGGLLTNKVAEHNCKQQEAARRPVAYHPQKGPWQNPDLAHHKKHTTH